MSYPVVVHRHHMDLCSSIERSSVPMLIDLNTVCITETWFEVDHLVKRLLECRDRLSFAGHELDPGKNGVL